MHDAWDTRDKLKCLRENPLVESRVIGKALSLPSSQKEIKFRNNSSMNVDAFILGQKLVGACLSHIFSFLLASSPHEFGLNSCLNGSEFPLQRSLP